MANSEYNLTVVNGTALTISLSGPVGPAGAGGGSGTVDATINDGSTNAVSGNAVFDALALKAPLASPSFTGQLSVTSPSGAFNAVSGFAPTGSGINGESNSGAGVYATSTSGSGVYTYSGSGTALVAVTGTSTNHATFGDTDINQSFVAREKGAFGWVRGSFTARINPANTLTGDRTYTLPDATGNVPVYTNIPEEGQVLTATNASGATTWVTATSADTVNTLVKRDEYGIADFSSLRIANDDSGLVPISCSGGVFSFGYAVQIDPATKMLQLSGGGIFQYTFPNADGKVPVYTGAAAEGKVLTSSGTTGVATWETPAVGTAVTGTAPIVVTSGVVSLSTTLPNNYEFSSFTRPTSSGSGTPDATSLITLQDSDNRDWVYSPNQQRVKTLTLASMLSTISGTGSAIGHTAGATRLVVGTSTSPALAYAGIYQTGNNNQAMMLALPNQTITSPSTFALTDFSRSVLLSFYGAFRASATGVNVQIGLGSTSQNGGVQMIDSGMAADLIWNGTNCDVALSVGKQLGNNSITGATNATPIVITDNTHGYANGDLIRVFGVLGNTAANGYFYIANVAANTFELVGSTGNGAYTSGGTSNKSTASIGTVNDNTVFAIDIVATAGTASLYLNGELTGSLAGTPLIKGAAYANVIAYQVGNAAASQVSIDSLRVGVR